MVVGGGEENPTNDLDLRKNNPGAYCIPAEFTSLISPITSEHLMRNLCGLTFSLRLRPTING